MAVTNLTPDWQTPLVDETGHATQSWFNFFARLTAKPQAISTVTPTASPFSFTASLDGALAISGGTVSSVKLTRGRVAGVNTGLTSGMVSMAQGDVVTVTYSAAPSISFIPA